MMPSDHTKASNAYWSERAEEYSALHENELDSERGGAFNRLLQGLLFEVKAQTQADCIRALEIGCGSGMISILLADIGALVTGIDYSNKMLAQARKNAIARNIGNRIEFLHADAHELPFDNESFDLVITRNVTWILDDVPGVYAEVLRVLRPNGLFANIDAPYGQAFIAADARGEKPVHPTQTSEQLRIRNSLIANLPISHVNRPAWDVRTLQDLGARNVSCTHNLERLLAVHKSGQDVTALPPDDGSTYSRASNQTSAQLFLVKAAK